jgi:hypothetical protein
MMEIENLNPVPGNEPVSKRPTLLTVLCILTFIGSGMNLFSSLFIAGFYDQFVEVMQVFAEKWKLPGIEEFMEARPAFFLASAICYAGSLAGAFMMMRLRKTGFHIYTVSQILLVLAPMYFLHQSGPGIADILFGSLFVTLYALNLKIMS